MSGVQQPPGPLGGRAAAGARPGLPAGVPVNSRDALAQAADAGPGTHLLMAPWEGPEDSWPVSSPDSSPMPWRGGAAGSAVTIAFPGKSGRPWGSALRREGLHRFAWH